MAHGWRRLARNTPDLDILSILRQSKTKAANGQAERRAEARRENPNV